jgi:hypothetical protein
MTTTCFVNHETREIVYCSAINDYVDVVWQQWTDQRDAVGRICVGRDLGRRPSLDFVRSRYTPGMGWQEMSYEDAQVAGKRFQYDVTITIKP